MCAQHITFHSIVDSSSSDMDLKSTKIHPNLHERSTYTTKSYAPSLECGPLQKQLQVLYPPIQVSYSKRFKNSFISVNRKKRSFESNSCRKLFIIVA